MKKLFTYYFALFAFVASASNGLGNMVSEEDFSILDTLAIEESFQIENNPQTFYISPETSITIQEGTITNFPLSGTSKKATKVFKNTEAVFYIASEVIFFMESNAITNAVVIYKKSLKKNMPIAGIKQKNGKIAIPRVEILQVSTANNPEKFSERILISVAVSNPISLKDAKGKTAIVSVVSTFAFIYRKRKSTRNCYCQNSLKVFSNTSAYALFSRPPTSLT